MAIAAESSSPTGLPLAAYWVAVGVAAALETSVNAAAVVAVCHASTESSSPSGRRAIRTRGARREAVSRQDVEAPVSGRCRRDERQCDNQPDERHERGRWRRKQQQLQLCNNQQKINGMKTCSSSHREVAVRQLTWRLCLSKCRGGSNGDYNVEMTTTTMTTAAASIGKQRGNGRGSAALPMVDEERQTQSTPTMTST